MLRIVQVMSYKKTYIHRLTLLSFHFLSHLGWKHLNLTKTSSFGKKNAPMDGNDQQFFKLKVQGRDQRLPGNESLSLFFKTSNRD